MNGAASSSGPRNMNAKLSVVGSIVSSFVVECKLFSLEEIREYVCWSMIRGLC